MKQHIQEIYNLGLEKFAGDHDSALAFTQGFVKEAFLGDVAQGAGKALGAGVVGLGLGLGIHGVSSAISSVSNGMLRTQYEKAFSKCLSSNPILAQADNSKVRSYGETIFKFAPHVAADPNLLSTILTNAVHGEGVDPMTIRTLADLESSVQQGRRNAMFTPKAYT